MCFRTWKVKENIKCSFFQVINYLLSKISKDWQFWNDHKSRFAYFVDFEEVVQTLGNRCLWLLKSKSKSSIKFRKPVFLLLERQLTLQLKLLFQQICTRVIHKHSKKRVKLMNNSVHSTITVFTTIWQRLLLQYGHRVYWSHLWFLSVVALRHAILFL